MNAIQIKGAKTHNLKNIDVSIGIGKITCIAGPSGSGKSSLAFHTLHAESKRRFINSFPSDIKFFWDIPNSASVDSIFPVLPVWALAQHNPILGSRPNIADIIGISEKLQKIFYLASTSLCPIHKLPFAQQDVAKVLLDKLKGKKIQSDEVLHFFISKDVYLNTFPENIFPSRSVNEKLSSIKEFDSQDQYWEIFRIKYQKVNEIEKKLESLGLHKNDLSCLVYLKKQQKHFILSFSNRKTCPKCDREELERPSSPQHLSPYNALGACQECSGYGMNLEYDPEKLVRDRSKSIEEGAVNLLNYKRFTHIFPHFIKECKKQGFDTKKPFHKLPKKIWTFLYNGSGKYPGFNELFSYLETRKYKKNVRIFIRRLQSEVLCLKCNGTRVNETFHFLSLEGREKKFSYKDVLDFTIGNLNSFIEDMKDARNYKLIKRSLEELDEIVKVSNDLSLSHLPLSRKAKHLSASEYQRSLLVKYLSFKGEGSLFILDEPSIGLTEKEQKILFKYLRKIQKTGNTILLVEHSNLLKSLSDELILMGPGAGHKGGEIVYQGKYKEEKIKLNKNRLYSPPKKRNWIELRDGSVDIFNKKTVKIPINELTLVRGSSALGYSSCIINLIANEIHKQIAGEKLNQVDYSFKSLKIDRAISEVLVFDFNMGQTTSRSTVGTVLDISPYIRKHFSSLPVSKAMSLLPGHFSPNSELGRCSVCEGKGVKTVDMQFLENIELTCEECKGMKIRPLYATISDGNMTAFQAFNGPMEELFSYLHLTPKMKRIWDTVKMLNLGHLSLDRSIPSLSGGERQRVKLASRLQKDLKDGLLIFENISFGLSSSELVQVGELFHSLLYKGNTIVVIDQNPFFRDISHHSID